MQKKRNYIFFILVGIIFNSCSKADYEATVPAYISIPSITLITDYATQGSTSSKITDAWVFVNDDLVGVYELPATFPVLKEGDQTVKVFAGIKDNGIAASRTMYLMYDPHEEKANLTAGDTVNIIANVAYNPSVEFTWLEDFEGASSSFLYTTYSDTIINKQATILKEGNFSGQILLEDEMDFFEVTSMPFTTLPVGGNVYLEMDFITNENLYIGVYLDAEQYTYITLNTNEEWKKIYINLKDAIKNNLNASEVKIFIGIKEELEIVFKTSQPEIYIDNIKLVHF